MVNMVQLWMPILLSAVLVFLASSLIWMALPYHRTDATGVPDENALADVLRRQKLAPGIYVVPWAVQKQRQTPEFQQKMKDGPVAMITSFAPGPMNMGKQLTTWFVYSVIISAIVAYVASHTVSPGQSYLAVFRVVGTVAWLAYGGAHAIYGIFWGRPWSVVGKDIFDALIYGCLTAGAFGWLWPH
jgi:hypothetical protein